MAQVNRYVDRPAAAVWAVLADGWRYADWVVGTRDILSVDRDWPAVGSSLQFRAGVPGVAPLQFEDKTVVRVCDPERELQLEAHALPMGTARVSLTLLPWGEGTLIVFDEHPIRGRGAATALHGVIMDAGLVVRGRWMMNALARVVEGGAH